MNRLSTKRIVFNGLMVALVFLTTYFTKIPGPVGPFNIGDATIMVAAVLLGRTGGFLAGAFGSAIADIAMGYSVFAPVTFVVKGLEGLLVGAIASEGKQGKKPEMLRIVGVVAGAAVMVAGYFLAETFVLKIVDPAFVLAKAIEELPFNLVQGGVSAAIGYTLSTILARVNINQYLV